MEVSATEATKLVVNGSEANARQSLSLNGAELASGEYITYNSGSALWGNQRSAFA